MYKCAQVTKLYLSKSVNKQNVPTLVTNHSFISFNSKFNMWTQCTIMADNTTLLYDE